MLKSVIKILLLLFVFQFCTNKTGLKNQFKSASLTVCSLKEYNLIRQNANDSIAGWVSNKLTSYGFEKNKFEYQLDSLLCINKSNTRLVTCLLERVLIKESNNDGIIFFYGEKINNQWFFFKGPSIVIPRSMVKDHPTNQPLSYQQLHQIALKEVYGGYLNNKGEINEAWFTHQFEGSGWGAPNYKGAKSKQDSIQIKDWYYKLQHARQNLRVWNSVRKVCSIYKLEDLSIDYNNTTQKIAVRFPVKSYESTFLFNDYYSYSYSINNVFVKLIEYNKLSPNDTSLKFSIKNIPNSCKLNLMIYLSEVGPLNFELEISNGKIISKKLKECLPKNSF